MDLLNRTRQCLEQWFERPAEEQLYVDICKYLGVDTNERKA